jgi:predicted phosphodiesterase
MRIAAISDIHGNLYALDAVLEDIRWRNVDLTVNLGDILSGPLLPRETADRLMEIDAPTIRGNHERRLLAPDRQRMGPSDLHAADSITAPQREWLTALPATRWITEALFMCHATPSSDIACFLEDIRDRELVPAPLACIEERAKPCPAALILCGHSHIPRVAHLRTGQIIVNPGSVGIQAYEGHHPGPHRVEIGSPHARYAIVEETARGWSAQLVAVPYDWEAAARLAERRARPEWAAALRTGYVEPGPAPGPAAPGE